MTWEARWQEADTPWDLGGPSPVVLRLAERLPPRQRLFVPGCGRAWEVDALADRGHSVVGLDLSPTAIAAAAARIGPRDDVQLVAADLFGLLDLGLFDAIVEHTCFCAIGPERYPDYVRSVTRLLRPGGVLFGAFLDFEGGGPPYGTNAAEVRACFGEAFTIELSPAEEFPRRGVPQLAAWMTRRA